MFGQAWNPPNRFDGLDLEWEVPPPKARLSIVEDHTRGILSHNRRPEIDFDWSVNPYRGCTHACGYCYARAFHEQLGYGAGTDFERRIVVKLRAAVLLKEAFEHPRWRGEHIAFSGATDCYQPLERRYEITRQCLEVCEEYRNPVTIVTRSPLVLRDVDLLQALVAHRAVGITISIPLWDAAVCKAMEPGAPSPAARLEAISRLAAAGIPVGVSIAPVIPGLNDHAMAQTMQRARAAGAQWAWYSDLRLPGAVAAVFERRLRIALPERADAVMAKVRRAQESAAGRRGRRSSPVTSATKQLFDLWRLRLGFGPTWSPPNPTPFRRPAGEQLGLFGSEEGGQDGQVGPAHLLPLLTGAA